MGIFSKEKKVIGVTIGIGSKYEEYARCSAKKFQKHTGIDVKIIDQKMFDMYDFRHMDYSKNEQVWLMKLYMFDLFPDVENIIYFDSDWCATSDFKVEKYLNKKELHVVRDRHFKSFVENAENLLQIEKRSYFNAGFYIINRTNHKRLLEHAREIYISTSKSWGEQCAMNRAVKDLNIPVYYLGKEYNYMDFLPDSWASKNINIKGIHTKLVYESKAFDFTKNDTVDSTKMIGASKNFILEIENQTYDLFEDGFTSGDFFWVITKKGFALYDEDGEQLDIKYNLKNKHYEK